MKAWEHITHMNAMEKRLASTWLKVNPSEVPSPPSGLVIGEMPGPDTKATLPLFPHPKNSSGGRLWQLSDLPLPIFLGKLRRTNLIQEYREEWPQFEAQKQAEKMMAELPEGTRVILCGTAVGIAFDQKKFYTIDTINGSWYVVIPHPSGRNRAYADPATRIGARYALRWAADTP